jgi:hypothetical protein
MKRYFFAALSLGALSGCSTYAIPNYSISADTVAMLKANVPGKVGLGEFTSAPNINGDITCRAVGPVKTPDGESYAQYLRNAFRSELIIAERYDARSPISLTGSLDNFTFDSNAGFWTVGLTVASSNGNSLRVEQKHAYATSFYGETACNQTAQAGMGAVQKTIGAVVTSPQFPTLLRLPTPAVGLSSQP